MSFLGASRDAQLGSEEDDGLVEQRMAAHVDAGELLQQIRVLGRIPGVDGLELRRTKAAAVFVEVVGSGN